MLCDYGLGRQLDFLLWVKVSLVSSLFSQTLRLSLQQYRCVRLRKEEEGNQYNGERPDSFKVLGPTPAKVAINNQRRTNKWTLFIFSKYSFAEEKEMGSIPAWVHQQLPWHKMLQPCLEFWGPIYHREMQTHCSQAPNQRSLQKIV
jgi:hypothetical protein